MRKSFAFLISSIVAAGLITGCAPSAAGGPSPSDADMEAAKKLRMPVIIYNVGVQKDEMGMFRPVVYFVNTSAKPVDVATFLIEGHTKDGKTVTLWADDYEKVSPGKSSQNGMLGGGWKDVEITCIELQKADLHIDGTNHRFGEEKINQLFLDQGVNSCD